MQRPVHPSFGRVKTIVDVSKYGWTGGGWVKKFRSKRWSSKTIDIVSNALESEYKWSHMCVCSKKKFVCKLVYS